MSARKDCVYQPSPSMLKILESARTRYMEYDTALLTTLRVELVNASLLPDQEEATYWLFSEAVKTVDDIIMGRAVV